MSLSLNKERSGRRATVGTTDNIQAIQGTLDVKKYLKATRNSLGISTSSFCQIIKQDLCWHSCQMIIWYQLYENDFKRRFFDFTMVCQSMQQMEILGQIYDWIWNGIFFKWPFPQPQHLDVCTCYQPPDFHFDVSNSRKKVTFWLSFCGNVDKLCPLYSTKMSMDKPI